MIGSYLLLNVQAKKPRGHRQTFVVMNFGSAGHHFGDTIFWTADQARNLAERLLSAADEADKEDGCEQKAPAIRSLH